MSALPPNLHHLELFYYVAKYGGITPAVRKMPYGIQQPAVSGQMLQLEKELGVKLFNRRPFALTHAGNQLFEFLNPFFSELPNIAEQLMGEESYHLRLAASGTVLSNHLPEVLDKLKKQYPNLKLSMTELIASESAENLLATQEIDIAITTLNSSLPGSVKKIELLKVPLVLVVPENSEYKTFSKLQSGNDQEITEPLISLSSEHTINVIFQNELKNRGINWDTHVEVTSLELISNYTNRGYGVGLTLDAPGIKLPKGLRKINLRGFPQLRMGILYQGKLKPIAEKFALLAAIHAKQLKT
ncbi:MAG: LysR family transcriptional regulator [Verrucomicrobiota bacterium]|nr:LysR family transcriptional regulator [Verrucomicrobiota bacterium]MEC8690030.1 LysR family transcriptional regulator [Verrucomicrobiota bacterium]|tara:strand:+ start:867 stop:1766 length:900 start_codon:yes stop_codon:yes gene_type:complete